MDATSTAQYLIPSLSALAGALIGAVAALAGVRWQIVADRNNKKAERIFNARREAYAEIMGVVNYSFLKGKDLKEVYSDPYFKTQISTHFAECFSRARVVASSKVAEKLRELFDAEMLLWKPENTAKSPTLTKKRADLAREVEEMVRQDLGIID